MQAKRRRTRQQSQGKAAAKGISNLHILGGALLLGGAVGTGTVATSAEGRSAIWTRVKPLAVSMGWARAREPQEGDWWPGCDPVREAGSAPLYRGEPGYREGMDGDGDGVACEPHYGR